jgi:hypothetical protein
MECEGPLPCSDFEVMNGHGIEKKEVNHKQESENYSGGIKESYCVAT